MSATAERTQGSILQERFFPQLNPSISPLTKNSKPLSLEAIFNMFSEKDMMPTRNKSGGARIYSDRTLALVLAASLLENPTRMPVSGSVAKNHHTNIYRIARAYNRIAREFGLRPYEVKKEPLNPETPLKRRHKSSPKMDIVASKIQEFLENNPGQGINLSAIHRSLENKSISEGTVALAYNKYKEERGWPQLAARRRNTHQVPSPKTERTFPAWYGLAEHLREKHGFTQKDVALALNKNHGTIKSAMHQMAQKPTRNLERPVRLVELPNPNITPSLSRVKLTQKDRRQILRGIYESWRADPKHRPNASKIARAVGCNFKTVLKIYDKLSKTFALQTKSKPAKLKAESPVFPSEYGVIRHLADKHKYSLQQIMTVTGLPYYTVYVALLATARQPEREFEKPSHKTPGVVRYGLVYNSEGSKTRRAKSTRQAVGNNDEYLNNLLAIVPKSRLGATRTLKQEQERLDNAKQPVRASQITKYFPSLATIQNPALARELAENLSRQISHLSRLWYKPLTSTSKLGEESIPTEDEQVDIIATTIVTQLRNGNGPFKKLAGFLGLKPSQVPINFDTLEKAIRFCIWFPYLEAHKTSENDYIRQAEPRQSSSAKNLTGNKLPMRSKKELKT